MASYFLATVYLEMFAVVFVGLLVTGILGWAIRYQRGCKAWYSNGYLEDNILDPDRYPIENIYIPDPYYPGFYVQSIPY